MTERERLREAAQKDLETLMAELLRKHAEPFPPPQKRKEFPNEKASE